MGKLTKQIFDDLRRPSAGDKQNSLTVGQHGPIVG
jgi:hypothetical protein